MSHQFTLNPIEARTKGEVKRLRKAGFVPVSIQHKGASTLHYQQEAEPLDAFIRAYGKATLLELVAPDNVLQRAIVQDVTRDPVSKKLQQVTFRLLQRDDTLKTRVPLVFHGEPAAVRSGDVMMQHPLETIEIECDPSELPDHIAVEVAELQRGDVLRVSDIAVDARYKILTPADTVIVSITSTRAAMGAADAAPAEPAV